MIENFLVGTATLFGDPFTIGVFIFGVLGGMFFGAIPGVSMLTLAAILLPFTADLTPSQGVMLFAVIYCTGTYGGAITAILFNIPGAPENAPTAFDGYPMTRKGLAGKAVGAAVLCSAIGGVASALVMMSATEPLAQLDRQKSSRLSFSAWLWLRLSEGVRFGKVGFRFFWGLS